MNVAFPLPPPSFSFVFFVVLCIFYYEILRKIKRKIKINDKNKNKRIKHANVCIQNEKVES